MGSSSTCQTHFHYQILVPCFGRELVENWLRTGWELVENWPRTGRELAENWPRTGWELVENWSQSMYFIINQSALVGNKDMFDGVRWNKGRWKGLEAAAAGNRIQGLSRGKEYVMTQLGHNLVAYVFQKLLLQSYKDLVPGRVSWLEQCSLT